MTISIAPTAKAGPASHGLPNWSGAPLYKKVLLSLIFSAIFLSLTDRRRPLKYTQASHPPGTYRLGWLGLFSLAAEWNMRPW